MNITLTINNSNSNLDGLNTKEMNALRKKLSYNIEASAAYFSNNQFNTRKFLIDKKGNFPTGLLTIALEELAVLDVLNKLIIKDLRIIPKSTPRLHKFNLKLTPYKAQTDAVEAAIENGRGTISMPTGTGKSLVIALIVAKLQLKTLIVVPNLEIKKQLIDGLYGMFDNLKYITIENIDSANLKKDNKYDCLIIDEAHHVAAKTYHRLNDTAWVNINHRFFLTATPFRNNTEETLLFKSIAGDVIYSLGYKEAISKGYIVPVEAYYVEIPKVKTNSLTWAQVYSELVVNNEYRNKVIADLAMSLEDSNIPTLVLVKEIKHGQNLNKLTKLPFANGKDEGTRIFIEQFNAQKLPVLIGTTGILGEGVNTKPCEYVIIAGLGKAKSAFMQQVGRAVRTYPNKTSAKIILIKDQSHKYCLKHFKEQVKILKDEYGITPVLLNTGGSNE